MKRYYATLWFWWAVTTAVYVVLTMVDPNNLFLRMFMYFVGLFVPYGILSLLYFASPVGWISLVVFIVAMVWVEKRLNHSNASAGTKILYIFCALLIITMLVDLARFTPFESWLLFLQGGATRAL